MPLHLPFQRRGHTAVTHAALALLALLPGAMRSAEPAAATPGAPFVIGNSVIRVLPPTRPDRQYELIIGLPASFKSKPAEKYPVVFVTDGYWDFTTVLATVGNMVYGKNVPEMIVVGLAYAGDNLDFERLRQDDLTPMTEIGVPTNPVNGHAAQFLEMIEKTAIPLLERDYRADPEHRYLMGCSRGGQFALFTLFTKPDLFQGYVADSASIPVLWQFEGAFAASGRTVKARVFMSTAENEWEGYRQNILAFYDRISKRSYFKGGLKFHLTENVRHAGGKPECYTQGLLYVCEPIAPETGVAGGYMTDPQNRPHYQINFWTVGAVSPAALKSHEDYLANAVATKKIYHAASTPPEVSERYSTAALFSSDPGEAENFAQADPAVRSGLLRYEVITVPGGPAVRPK